MSLILANRCSSKASSKASLAKRVKYISDPNHRHHKDKMLLRAHNYNCRDQSAAGFIAEVLRLNDEYFKARQGKRGKRSPRLFDELVYSTPLDAYFNDLERNATESIIIERFFRDTGCRINWHHNQKTGRADAHFLFASKNSNWPPGLTLWEEFGGCDGANLYATLNQIDSDIADAINHFPDRLVKITSAQKVHRATYGPAHTLAQEIATQISDPIDETTIADAIIVLGHTVKRLTDRTISVIFKGRVKPRRYNLADLLTTISVIQEIAKERTTPEIESPLPNQAITPAPSPPRPKAEPTATPPELPQVVSVPPKVTDSLANHIPKPLPPKKRAAKPPKAIPPDEMPLH